MAFLNPAEFALEVSKGNITGHTRLSLIARNAAVTMTEVTTWPESTDYTFPAAASTMTVSSDSASDATAGVGARTVLISGLDSNYVAVSETINPNGTTGTTTSNSYLRINSLLIVTTGSSNFNVGTIYIGTGTITAGKPAVVVNLMTAEIGASTSGFYTTAASNYAGFVNTNATVDAVKLVISKVCVHTEAGVRVCAAETLIADGVNLGFTWPTPLIPPKSDIELRARVDTGTGGVSINLGFVLIDSTKTVVTV